jgi:peptidoglycan/LPS O-acetylase OafA/YrhL
VNANRRVSDEEGGSPLADVTKDRGRIEFPYLDGIRGLASIAVVFYHALLFTGLSGSGPADLPIARLIVGHGYLGVPVFIVLSGYVLMLPVALNDRLWYRRGFRNYITRRARRILPPYYAALIFTLLLIALIPVMRVAHGTQWDTKLPVTFGGAISHFLMLHDLTGGWIGQINGPMWSVAVEWQIYFLMPLMLLLWRRMPSWAAAAIVLAISLVPGLVGVGTYAHPWLVGLFAVGMLAADLTLSGRIRVGRRASAWFAAALVVVGAAYVAVPPLRAHGWLIEVVVGCLVGYGLLWLGQLALKGRHNVVMGFFESRPMMYLGLTSYSIYLFHSPLLGLANLLLLPLHLPVLANYLLLTFVAVPLALCVCWLMFNLVEKHFLNARQKSASAEMQTHSEREREAAARARNGREEGPAGEAEPAH